MTTLVRTNQGFYAMETVKGNRHVPAGKIRMYFATIEVCEIDAKQDDGFDETQFALLAALPSLLEESDKTKAAIVRRALKQLAENLNGNMEHFE